MRKIFSLLIALLVDIHLSKQKKELVTIFDKSRGSTIFGKDSSYFAVLIESKESDDYDDYFDEFTKAAKNFEDKVKFVYINTDVEENWQLIEYLGLIAEDIPAIIFIDLEKGLLKYKAELEEITKANIIDFTHNCLDGKGVPFSKSDDVPEGWSAKPVKELVGSIFEREVFDSDKNTFVFFYAPWCAACQEAIPEVEKLAKFYEDRDDIVIAQMNSITNEVPGLPILDVPTIALFKKGERQPIYHFGDEKNAMDFSKFIDKNIGDSTEEEEVKEEDKDKKKKERKEDKKSEKKKEKSTKENKTKEDKVREKKEERTKKDNSKQVKVREKKKEKSTNEDKTKEDETVEKKKEKRSGEARKEEKIKKKKQEQSEKIEESKAKSEKMTKQKGKETREDKESKRKGEKKSKKSVKEKRKGKEGKDEL